MDVMEERRFPRPDADSLQAGWTDAGALRLAGELDLATAPLLEEILDGTLDGDRDLVIDVSALTFMDAAGVRAFLKIASSLRGRAKMVLRSPSGVVRRVLELTGTTQMAHIEVVGV